MRPLVGDQTWIGEVIVQAARIVNRERPTDKLRELDQDGAESQSTAGESGKHKARKCQDYV